ncbi:MAG TPA: HEPN domain-containing protein [Lamprocystis sp. (in: g-proteobacteria)]|nr:HEPN domain-containing protein [Lamprocystis sp. (in: g-proteobacteria)]
MEKARRDLASAIRLLDGEPPYLDTAVYHCQQAAEKALKGFLAGRGRSLRRVHDLVLLLAECTELDPSFDPLADAAAMLTPYGTAFRYPGNISEPSLPEAREAVVAARCILDLAALRLVHGPG